MVVTFSAALKQFDGSCVFLAMKALKINDILVYKGGA